MGKRLFDMVLSLIGLMVLSPVFLLVMLLLLLFERTSPFFIQQRVGYKGRLFSIYKFRTMRPEKSGRKGFDAGNTDRITPVGRFLRKTKLDELPQLFNVLKGDMSLVGPRPEVLQWTQVYPKKWKIIHSVLPGITDYASMSFRDEESILSAQPDPEVYYRDTILPQKLSLNIHYVKNRSLYLDIKIIMKTIKLVWLD